MIELTQKQQDILDFIEEFIQREGMSPTVYEIAEFFGIKSATAFAHLRALQRKGYVDRSSKARSLTLMRRGGTAKHVAARESLANSRGQRGDVPRRLNVGRLPVHSKGLRARVEGRAAAMRGEDVPSMR